MDIDIIKKLAVMARVDMDEAEMQEIANSFGPILSYVGQIQEVSETSNSNHQDIGDVPFNILREDIVTNKSGEFTDKILSQSPGVEKGFLKVKQIL
jgi:aspartyl/glutamyl-tRNA(Asn/Gln) amidotransferase C subunit